MKLYNWKEIFQEVDIHKIYMDKLLKLKVSAGSKQEKKKPPLEVTKKFQTIVTTSYLTNVCEELKCERFLSSHVLHAWTCNLWPFFKFIYEVFWPPQNIYFLVAISCTRGDPIDASL